MNEPRRLSQSGGVAQRLLDSASIDRPSVAARRRAEIFAGTASSFSRTAADSGVQRKQSGGSLAKTLVTWAFIGAAASVALAFAASRLLEGGGGPSAASAPTSAAPMAELSPVPARPAARPSDIKPEPGTAVHVAASPVQPAAKPLGSIVPWVPSPAEATTSPEPVAVGTPQPARPSSASFEEVREIQAAREAVSRGDNSSAIATLNQYDQTHPSGVLKAESTVLRVQALSNSGRTTEAKQLANEFTGKNPTHPLTPQLKSVAK
ncbi:MAG TPA: hypothetical protein VHB79_13080 [Polyangiaceae bacterium]|nr:hypothetical protein [Polyangiaceae bacterium]